MGKQALKEFEETGSIRWLPAEEIHKINLKNLKEGKPRVTQPFGKFEDDVEHLDQITALAKVDFPHSSKFLRGNIKKWRKGTDEDREELRKMNSSLGDLLDWPEEDAEAFSQWMIAWMQHAGYVNPKLNPRFWKSCIMQAFPKIGEGATHDEMIENFVANPVPLWTKVDTMMNSYMKTMKDNEQAIQALSKLKVTNVQICGAA